MGEAEHMPDEVRLRELLVGCSVQRVEISDKSPEDYVSGPTGHLHLSDGTSLQVWGNDGGCACSAGCYPLKTLAAFDNVITSVEVEARPDDDSSGPCHVCGEEYCYKHSGWYRIFVFAGQERALLASFEGSDGNGYYGTGWWLTVAPSAVSS